MSVDGKIVLQKSQKALRLISRQRTKQATMADQCSLNVASAAEIYDGVDAPPTASMCQSGGVEHHLREASVSKVIMIGLDIAKHVFHAHGFKPWTFTIPSGVTFALMFHPFGD